MMHTTNELMTADTAAPPPADGRTTNFCGGMVRSETLRRALCICPMKHRRKQFPKQTNSPQGRKERQRP